MDEPLILVLQMAKVASLAWYEAIKRACPGQAVRHLHHVNPRIVAEYRARRAVRGPTQTFRNLAMLRQAVSLPDPAFEAALQRALADGRRIRIVSGVRDPIDRSISVLFFYADFYGHTAVKLSHREKPTIDSLLAYFVDTWRSALSGRTARGTFEQALQTGFVSYRDWFDREIVDVFALDLDGVDYDFDEGCLRARTGSVELICYRFEDLDADKPAMRKALDAVSTMLGAPIAELPRVNATDDRRARQLYRAFRQEVKLPEDIIAAVYAPPILSKFYRPDEIGRMKQRWSAGR